MSEHNILTALDELSSSVLQVHSLLNDTNKITLPAKYKVKRLLLRSIQALFNLFTSDEWYKNKLLELYKPLGTETRAIIVINGEAREIRHRATLMDLLESMVMHKVAYDSEARKLLKDSIIEILRDTMIKVDGKEVTVKEYFEMRGVKWDKAREHLEKEIDIALDILKQELDLYNNPQPGNYVTGDRLAYYIHVRNKLARVNKTYEKIVSAVTTSISFTLGVALASRRFREATGIAAITRGDADVKEVVREMLGNLPEKLVSKALESDNPYKLINEYRFKLNKTLTENLMKVGSRKLGITLTIPVSTTEIEEYATKSKAGKEEKIRVRLVGQHV